MLTDTSIKKAEFKDKPYKIQDEKGMYLFVTPSKGKFFRLDYAISGKRKTLSIGSYPNLSLKEAREIRDTARKQISDGIDPSSAKKFAVHNKSIFTFDEMFKCWCDINVGWSHQYRADVEARTKLHISPFIGNLSITEITRENLICIINRLIDRKMVSKSVSKLHSFIISTFEFSIASGICDRNIAIDVEPLLPVGSPVTPQKMLTKEEFISFIPALNNYKGRIETVAALRLMMWSATRAKETYAAKWVEFKLDEGMWYVPLDRMKKRRYHIVPLPKQAVEELTRLRRISGHCEYVFPNNVKPTTHISENTLNKAVQSISKTDATAHGMRSVFSTWANEHHSKEKDAIEYILSHVDGSIRGIYNRYDYINERKIILQQWADYIDSLC